MPGSQFIKVASVRDIHEGQGTKINVNGEDVAIFKRGDRLFAIHNVCAHQHFSILHRGEVDGLTVSCPMHGWTYDLVTGRSIVGNGKVRTYVVKVVGDDLYLELPLEEKGWGV